MEIGVFKGGSLFLWKDYFPNGQISGIDLNVPLQLNNEERIADLSRQYLTGKGKRSSKFELITITSSIVFIKKHRQRDEEYVLKLVNALGISDREDIHSVLQEQY